MRILVRHPAGDADGRLASHAEKLLRRVLDRYCLSISLVPVRLNTSADAEGALNSRCTLRNCTGWYYDIGTGKVFSYNPGSDDFAAIT